MNTTLQSSNACVEAPSKIVTQLPLTELWRDDGFTTTERRKAVAPEDIARQLRPGSHQFVVAELGQPPRWVTPEDTIEFWKTDVRIHLLAPGTKVYLDECPGGYCYFASEWGGGEGPIIVLEKQG